MSTTSAASALRARRGGVLGHLDPRTARGRLGLATISFVLAALASPASLHWQVRACIGWDVGSTVLLALAWVIIQRSDAAATEARVRTQDPGRTAVWLLSLGSSTFSLFAAVGILRHVKDHPGLPGDVLIALCLYAVASAWAVTHTSYTFRYARLYYRGEAHCGDGKRGLAFPAEPDRPAAPPSDLDFAYFAFTLGMCFQTSDVMITSRELRRAVLAHAVLSFVFNTVILALALNLTFGLAG